MSRYEPVNDNATPAWPERRRNVRLPALMRGKIVYPGNNLTADCTIRDVSPTGARVRVNPEAITAAPFLIVVKDSVVHQARTAWRTSTHAGLSFSRTFELGGPVPLFLKRIQRIWAELALR